MTASPDLLVFSDLDGTLLSHEGYSWAPARPALKALRERECGLVLASSKTAAEIAPLRREMGFADWPAIVENGGGVLASDGTGAAQGGCYDALRAAIGSLPPGFRGFGDMTASEVAEATGLSEEAAALAKARHFTEPGLWTGRTAELDAFLAFAAEAGLTGRWGGRFLTLSFGGTKADRMDEITKRHGPRHTMALGDAPNDIEMLQRAEFGVIVRNGAAPPLPDLPEEETGQVIRTRRDGPAGWNEAVLARLQALPPPVARARER